jgi:hypothetical protein
MVQDRIPKVRNYRPLAFSEREFLPPLFVFEYVNNADPAATGEKILINTATSSITGLITEFHKVSSIKSAGWGCRYI